MENIALQNQKLALRNISEYLFGDEMIMKYKNFMSILGVEEYNKLREQFWKEVYYGK